MIGAKADALRSYLNREHNLILDIRDRSWFAERCLLDQTKERLADEYSAAIVDPILSSKKLLPNKGLALDPGEVRAAFVYLKLQWEDDSRQKGLTKVCFDALVRCALRDTDSNTRHKRSEIHAIVASYLQNTNPELVIRYVDQSLSRLNKKIIRHWQSVDEFCLTHEEKTRLSERLLDLEEATNRLMDEIRSLIADYKNYLDMPDLYADDIRRLLEQILLKNGELFASSWRTGKIETITFDDVRTLLYNEISKGTMNIQQEHGEAVLRIIRSLIADPGEAAQYHLRSLADAYTLMAFLRETADVQSAIGKMFDHGMIWLDTSLVLPLIAESLIDEESLEAQGRRRYTSMKWGTYTRMVGAAGRAGMKLFVTEGVLEEVERHFNLCAVYASHRETGDAWYGQAPFLYSAYAASGRPLGKFGAWMEEFRGPERPVDDIGDFLREEFDIRVENLEDDLGKAPQELRVAVHEEWVRIHELRRSRQTQTFDELAMMRLAQHDQEMFVGVVQRRLMEQRASPLGYSTWWLTLDREAYEITERVNKSISGTIISPIMSSDFLLNYLAVGPARSSITKGAEATLPVMVESRMMDVYPVELVELVEGIWKQYEGLPERVIWRNIRDELDKAKRRTGAIVQGGVSRMRKDLLRDIRRDERK